MCNHQPISGIMVLFYTSDNNDKRFGKDKCLMLMDHGDKDAGGDQSTFKRYSDLGKSHLLVIMTKVLC